MGSNFQSLFNETSLNINVIVPVDDISIDYNSTGQLEVKDGGITTGKIANLAVTNAKINDMDAIKLTGTITIPVDNTEVTTDLLITGQGTESNPSITFLGDLSTGIYNPNSWTLTIVNNGSDTLVTTPTVILMQRNLVVVGLVFTNFGTAAAPAYGFLTNSGLGIYRSLANTLSIAANSAEVARFTTTFTQLFNSLTCQSVIVNDGTPSSPAYGFSSNSGLGLFRNSAQTMSVASNSIEVMRFNFSTSQLFVPLVMGSNPINCGLITCHGVDTGIYDVTTTNLVADNVETNSATLLGGTPYGLLSLNNSNDVITSNLSNGQILIGSSGNAAIPANITGTANQITVTNGSNTITLSSPQDIATSSTPTFGGGFINGTLVIGRTSVISTGYNRLQLYGTSGSSTGPFIQAITSSDNFPLFQLLPFTHDNISLNFDAYYDGSWRSASTTSNFQIGKASNLLSFNYSPGAALGTAISSLPGNQALTINTTGQVGIPNLLMVGRTTNITTGIHKMIIYGTDNSSSGPHIETYTSADNFPLFQVLSQQHNNVVLGFDTYFDGTTYRSGYSSSNFLLGKVGNQLRVYFGAATAGSIPTLTIGSYWDLNGNFSVQNDLIIGGKFFASGQPFMQRIASTYMSVVNNTVTSFNRWDITVNNQGGITCDGTNFTVPTIGLYSISVEIQADAAANGTRNVYIIKNGSITEKFGQISYPTTSTDEWRGTTEAKIYLTTSDYVCCNVYQNCGSNLHMGTINTNGTSRFTIYKAF